MKKIILILVSVFAFGSVTAIAASPISQKEIAKMAKKRAKELKKEGWIVAPGALPMEAQLADLYSKQYDKDEVGRPKFLIGESQPTAEFYDAASLQAMAVAKLSIARQLSSDITAHIEQEQGNIQLPREEAVSVENVKAKSQEIVSTKLGRVIPLFTCHKKLQNGNTQMMVQVGYPSIEGLEQAKEALREKLNRDIEGLGEKFKCLQPNK